MNSYPTIFETLYDWMNEKGSDDYSSNFPPTDIYLGDEDSLVFDFAIAGYDPKNIHITFSGDSLQISSISEDEVENSKKMFKHRIAKRDFNLKYSLAPGKFDPEKAKASHKNGILNIVIPRSEFSKPREILIDLN